MPWFSLALRTIDNLPTCLEENMASKNQALEIGVLLHTAGMTGDSVSVPDLSPLWEQTMLVEDLGYASAWVGDSSRTETAWPRADCVSLMTAMAMKTSTLKLGTVPLSVPLRNPVLLAHSSPIFLAVLAPRLYLDNIMIGARFGVNVS